MTVALIMLAAKEGYKLCSKKYHKRQAVKYNYAGILGSDKLGRPIDKQSGKKLSRNEARAYAAHQRQIKEDEEKERQWRVKGNVLPTYGQLQSERSFSSIGSSSSMASISNHSESADASMEDESGEEWKRWSISGSPLYTEHDERPTAWRSLRPI
jgi:hypothetical protein